MIMLRVASILIFTSSSAFSQCNVSGRCKGTFLQRQKSDSMADCLRLVWLQDLIMNCVKTCQGLGPFFLFSTLHTIDWLSKTWFRFGRSLESATWVSWLSEFSICTALADCPVRDNDHGTVSSKTACPNCSQDYSSCHGTYIDHAFVETQADCLYKCAASQDCAWYTFYWEEQLCILMKDCTTMHGCGKCTSGEKDCKLNEASLVYIDRRTGKVHAGMYKVDFFKRTAFYLPLDPRKNKLCPLLQLCSIFLGL